MKKILLLSFSCIMATSASAQLTVDVNGNIGVGDTITSYNSQLSVNGAGLNNATVFVNTGNREYGIYSENIITNNMSNLNRVGVIGNAKHLTSSGVGRSIGVLGTAANCSNGYNYGVFGVLDGVQNGGAIVGTISKTMPLYPSINGRYAGYFVGPVLATGIITAPNITVPSSAANVTDVSNLDSERSYQGIMSLTPVEYKQVYSEELESEVIDTISSESMAELEKMVSEKKASERPHFGFIAEDVQKVYPELVHEDSEGGLSVDYIGLIPLLIQTVQQLDAEVKALRGEGGLVKGMGPETGMGDFGANSSKEVQLSTNGSCEIEYMLPDAVKSARLYIYSISGKLVDSCNIDVRGNGKLTVDTSKLGKGIYIYTLIADGQPISSRQMIVQ
ncbi:MAG: tail fiber domain-containing protein [Bacteroidales bacterium]|nr:tail fiber domain-containing protein [Bacteroidales bacterium]